MLVLSCRTLLLLFFCSGFRSVGWLSLLCFMTGRPRARECVECRGLCNRPSTGACVRAVSRPRSSRWFRARRRRFRFLPPIERALQAAPVNFGSGLASDLSC
ncbi:unnamed protein product [Ectocarpus fasciculatus]